MCDPWNFRFRPFEYPTNFTSHNPWKHFISRIRAFHSRIQLNYFGSAHTARVSITPERLFPCSSWSEPFKSWTGDRRHSSNLSFLSFLLKFTLLQSYPSQILKSRPTRFSVAFCTSHSLSDFLFKIFLYSFPYKRRK